VEYKRRLYWIFYCRFVICTKVPQLAVQKSVLIPTVHKEI